MAAAGRFPADAGVDRRHPGAPYLTMPLMDKVLIPYQNGAPIDTDMVTLLLAGLFGSHCWPGDWAGPRPTSSRWSASASAPTCAPITYDHLLHLSLEYFGGKRTGDLMARIGSESDASACSCRCTCWISPPMC